MVLQDTAAHNWPRAKTTRRITKIGISNNTDENASTPTAADNIDLNKRFYKIVNSNRVKYANIAAQHGRREARRRRPPKPQ